MAAKYVVLAAAALAAAMAATAPGAPSASLSTISASATEADGIAAFEAFTSSGAALLQADGSAAIDFCMTRGWWHLSMRILQAAQAAGVDLGTTVHQTASRIRGKLQELADALQRRQPINAGAGGAPGAAAGSGSGGSGAAPGGPLTGIAPAFEWAQSPDTLFLNVKFSHKLDTPATLGCETDTVIFMARSVSYRAECKDKKKAFLLNLSLLRDIDADNSTVAMASVGRVMVTLRKAENSTGVWPRLTAGAKKLPNSHVWWAMQEKYASANDGHERARRAREEAEAEQAEAAEEAAAAATAAAALAPATATPAAEPAAAAAAASVAESEATVSADGSVAAAPSAGGDASDAPAESSGGGVSGILSAAAAAVRNAAEAVDNMFTLPVAAAAPASGRQQKDKGTGSRKARGGQGADAERDDGYQLTTDEEEAPVFDDYEDGAAPLPTLPPPVVPTAAGAAAPEAGTVQVEVSSGGDVQQPAVPSLAANSTASSSSHAATGIGSSVPSVSPSAVVTKAAAEGKTATEQNSDSDKTKEKASSTPTGKAASTGKASGDKKDASTDDAKSKQKQQQKKKATPSPTAASKKADKKKKRRSDDDEDDGAPLRISADMMFQQLASSIEMRRQQELAQIPKGARKDREEVHAKYEKEFADLRRQLHVED